MESFLGLGHEQSIDKVKGHQEASAGWAGNRPGKRAHRFSLGGVEGFDPQDKIAPLLQITELLFRSNGVSFLQKCSTSP